MKDPALHRTLANVISLALLLIFISSPSAAFYERQGDESAIDIRGMLQVYGLAYRNPRDAMLYKDSGRSGIAGIGRLIVKVQSGGDLTLEANAYQTYIPEGISTGGAGTNLNIPEVERSSALERSLSDDNYVHAAVDRLNLRWSRDRWDIIIGRQPINLATTFYFSPNDFFAPFAAQTFYRVYKPGVDALRAEVRLGALSQLSLITVLGYSPDRNSDTGWGNRPDSSRTSYIGRISTELYGFEWAFLAGALADSDVIGGSLQGEAFKWLGIRAEGHMAYPDSRGQDPHAEITLGIEHHWENSLDVRLEYFYHGSGTSSSSGYTLVPSINNNRGSYLGRHYSALGIGYEFTPLLTGQMALIGNLVDNSLLSSLNAVYSLSNESEISFTLAAPIGRRPDGLNIRSEFGLYPRSIGIEWRWYF